MADLTRRRAKALIARRLSELGQPGDYLTQSAGDELYLRSHGTEAGLLAALAATLFLASTEDAARIDREHVRTAVPEAEPSRLKTSEHQRSLAALLAGGLVAGCMGIAVLLMTRSPTPGAPGRLASQIVRVSPGPVPAAPKLPDQTPHRAAPTTLAMTSATPHAGPSESAPPGEMSHTSHRPSPPPPLDTIFVRSPPLPPEAAQRQEAVSELASFRQIPPDSAALPTDPPALVTLVVPASDRLERSRLAGLAERLRLAGMSQIRLERIDFGAHLARPIPRGRVFYFFAQDLPLAQHVATLLDNEDAGDARRNPWVPYLVLPPPGIVPHPPGSIEAYIP